MSRNTSIVSLIEFGNQRNYVDEKTAYEIRELLQIKKSFYFEKRDRRTPSASHFYTWLGVKTYACIDVNSKDGAMIMDLNKDIREEYGFNRQFDLVLNNGTGEHVFNQSKVFENLHQLCNLGGTILNILPLSPWLNHGFYNYNPVLPRDIAYANNYEWEFLWIGDNQGWYKEFSPEGQVYRETKRRRPYSLIERFNPRRPHPYSDIEAFIFQKMRRRGNATLVAAYKKVFDVPFVTPLQGKWLHNIESNQKSNMFEKYKAQPDTFYKFHS